MIWDIEPEQVLNGELTLSMTDFMKILWTSMKDVAVMDIPDKKIDLSNLLEDSHQNNQEFKTIFYIHYLNMMLNRVMGQPRSFYVRHCKKVISDPMMKKFFCSKGNYNRILQQNENTIAVLNAVIKKHITHVLEHGGSPNRVSANLSMEVLNSVSHLVPDIRKNEEHRKQLIPIELTDSSLSFKVKRLFKF